MKFFYFVAVQPPFAAKKINCVNDQRTVFLFFSKKPVFRPLLHLSGVMFQFVKV